eukprot:CAMPEP_0172421714 /NCGR_PEP_ID=MMETSP1064-20121228/7936_1 /TAXON_ID=202472 /ORGANISM="Aulacoseira subarctica , Strain CCAP 1002/5" /LENGTH=149 /DNA_ID=CAMNT_0013162243 /DNA_START=38 /DNA_END=487 /DNA_ORIENTATION=+
MVIAGEIPRLFVDLDEETPLLIEKRGAGVMELVVEYESASTRPFLLSWLFPLLLAGNEKGGSLDLGNKNLLLARAKSRLFGIFWKKEDVTACDCSAVLESPTQMVEPRSSLALDIAKAFDSTTYYSTKLRWDLLVRNAAIEFHNVKSCD